MEAFLPSMAMLGLTVLVLGWIAQLNQSLGKDLKVNAVFLVCQIMGCVLLAVDRYSMDDQFSALLNLTACAFASLILLRISGKKK
jgi:hypothetical protein